MVQPWQYEKPGVGEIIRRDDGAIGMVMDVRENRPDLRMFGEYRVVVQLDPEQPDDEWETWYLNRGERENPAGRGLPF